MKLKYVCHFMVSVLLIFILVTICIYPSNKNLTILSNIRFDRNSDFIEQSYFPFLKKYSKLCNISNVEQISMQEYTGFDRFSIELEYYNIVITTNDNQIIVINPKIEGWTEKSTIENEIKFFIKNKNVKRYELTIFSLRRLICSLFSIFICIIYMGYSLWVYLSITKKRL